MKCFNCEQTNWHLFDRAYMGWPERDMGVCKECGTIAYQVEPEEEAKVREYYRHNYRGTIGPNNLLTTSRKLNYVKNFIGDWLSEREKSGKKLIIGDAGCSTGYIVDWFRRRGHKATGSEWTPSMRRFAEHFYGIPVTEELTPTHKYDLIVMYHTFEHFIEPQKKLERYMGMLADDGYLMISVPEWMDLLDETGSGKVTTFKEFFHKDHINVFSKNSLKRLFNKADLFITKEDHLIYGQTYLLRKRKENEPPITFDNEPWEKMVDDIKKQKEALDCYQKATHQSQEIMYREAIKIWPRFPDAYFDWILNSTQKKDRARCAELIQESLAVMPGNVKMHIVRAYFLYQNEEWAAALDDFDYIVKTKVNEDVLMYRGFCLHHLGRIQEAMNSFHEASIMNPQKWMEAMVWMCKCASETPAWDEVATQKIKQQLFDQAQVNMLPKDPVFETNEIPIVDSNGSNSNGNGHATGEKGEKVSIPSDSVPTP